MKVTLIPSEVCGGVQLPGQGLTSYVINDTVAIDAGSIGLLADVERQSRIKHVFLSHTHLDHTASLPMLIDNTFDPARAPITVHGSDTVLESLQKDIFNGRTWPDFIALSAGSTRFLQLAKLTPNRSVEADGLKITPVTVDHAVPTMGFVVEDANSTIVFSSDTGPTQALWTLANQTPRLKAVFLEATFPDALSQLAAETKHLTPATFATEIRKIQGTPRLIAVHLKPRYREQTARELTALGLTNFEIARHGEVYEF